jgi:hypothetical protein
VRKPFSSAPLVQVPKGQAQDSQVAHPAGLM